MKKIAILFTLLLSACYAKGSSIDILMNKEIEVLCQGDFEGCYWEINQSCGDGEGFEVEDWHIRSVRFLDSKSLMLNVICYDD